MTACRVWDWEDGDAQDLAGVAEDSLDFVHSSHCLEHLRDPAIGPGGLVQGAEARRLSRHHRPGRGPLRAGQLPAQRLQTATHKWTFTVNKARSWSEKSINLLELLAGLGPAADIEKIALLNSTYRYGLPRYDQTLTPDRRERHRVVVRKRSGRELAAGAWCAKPPSPRRPTCATSTSTGPTTPA